MTRSKMNAKVHHKRIVNLKFHQSNLILMMRRVLKRTFSGSSYNPKKFSITMTQHPTNPNTAQLSKGQLSRPFLWTEVRHYQSMTSSLIQNLKINNAEQRMAQFSTWYDFDRHQDQRTGIFVFMFLVNVRGILEYYGKQEPRCNQLIPRINAILTPIENKFIGKTEVNPADYVAEMTSISAAIDALNLPQSGLIHPKGFNAHYRISSSDLRTEEGCAKISKRIEELVIIQQTFGKCPVSEIIIADCQSVSDMDILEQILDKKGFKKVHIVPLIEAELTDIILKEIMDQDIKKVMFAGSDSVKRQTYVGALMIKLKIQKFINLRNKQQQITFFEGTGSKINRNGNMIWSRMGTILDNIMYERTIQGRQRQSWMNDASYMKQIFEHIQGARRCTMQELEDAMVVLNDIYQEVSTHQKMFQREPAFSNRHKKQQIFTLVQLNSHSGSRTTKPKDIQKFKIKDQRAIMQSFIIDTTGFHPQLMFWGKLSSKTLKQLILNLDNPILQDLVNHYTCLVLMADTQTARLYLKSQVLHAYQQGIKSLKETFSKIKLVEGHEETVRNKLLLFRSEEEVLKTIFDCSQIKDGEVIKLFDEYNKVRRSGKKELHQVMKGKLFHRTGIGYATIKQY